MKNSILVLALCFMVAAYLVEDTTAQPVESAADTSKDAVRVSK
jgi:hypothetical protein